MLEPRAEGGDHEPGIISSFHDTTPAFIAGRKGRTRREWADSHAAKFHVDTIFQAYDRSPRVSGAKKVGMGRIVAPLRQEPISRDARV